MAAAAPAFQPLSVSIGLIGPGVIGSALLGQIAAQAPKLLAPLCASRIGVVALANSRAMLLPPAGAGAAAGGLELDLGAWRQQLAERGEPLDLPRFAAALAAAHPPGCGGAGPGPGAACSVLVDCSASAEVAAAYPDFLRAGLHVVTPNKKAGAGPLAGYEALRELSLSCRRRFMYEATVGAGLPIISTLQGLLESGDQVTRVEGILSGTLSYIFNTYRPGMSFSSVVLDAKARGYTEPDPRDDLAGVDVARKVVILARECGLQVELEGLNVESLVPKELESASVAEYLERLPQFDAAMAARAAEAAAAGGVVRYVGCVDVEAGSASVQLRTYPASHPFAQLAGSDNMVVFASERYSDTPLIVRGPGAGPQVTAAGVFTDIIQVIRSHPRA